MRVLSLYFTLLVLFTQTFCVTNRLMKMAAKGETVPHLDQRS